MRLTLTLISSNNGSGNDNVPQITVKIAGAPFLGNVASLASYQHFQHFHAFLFGVTLDQVSACRLYLNTTKNSEFGAVRLVSHRMTLET